MTEKKILEGHKKIGSRFIPPIMQLPNWTEISYINHILPEILWMGLLNDSFGYRQGINLSFNLAKIAFELKEIDKYVNFTLASNFKLLSDDKKSEMVSILVKRSIISKYRDALLPMIALYEGFPLSFIGLSDKVLNKLVLIQKMKNCVEKHFNKYETPALIIQANVMYVRGSTGGLYIAPHIEMPDLNTLIDDPESEKAERAGAFARISAMQELMPTEDKKYNFAWSMSFWNQNHSIDKCDFSWEKND